MKVRYFTVGEATAVLEEIEPLMGDLLTYRAKVARVSREVSEHLDDPHLGFGGPVATQLTQDFIVIESLLQRIKEYGCVVKSLEAGLVDFLAEVNGRDVYLCWRYGEDGISYYHDLNSGFRGRTPL